MEEADDDHDDDHVAAAAAAIPPPAANPTLTSDDDRIETQGMSGSEAALYVQCYGRVLLQFLIVNETYKSTSRSTLFSLARDFLVNKCKLSKDEVAAWDDEKIVDMISSDTDIGDTFLYVFEFLDVDVANSTEPFLQSTDGDMGPLMGTLTYLYYNAVFLGHFKVANNVLDFLENYLRWQEESPNIIRWMSLNWKHVNGFFVEHMNAMIRIGMRGNLSFEAIERESLLVELKYKTREGFRTALGLRKRSNKLPELQRRAQAIKGDKYAKERATVASNLEELFKNIFSGAFKHNYIDRKDCVFNSKLKKMPSGTRKGGAPVGFAEMKEAWVATLTQEKKKKRNVDEFASMKVADLWNVVREELPLDKVPKKGSGSGKTRNVVKADLVNALITHRLELDLELERKAAAELLRLTEPQNFTRGQAKKMREAEQQQMRLPHAVSDP